MLTTTDLERVRAVLKESEPALDDIDRALALIEADILDVQEIAREVAPTDVPPGGRETFLERSHREACRSDLTFLSRGVTVNDGVSNPRVAARCGLPGLLELDRMRTKIAAKRQHEIARLADAVHPWPRPFRLLPGKKHGLPDRNMLPGEVVELNEAQARAFADKFEPVTPEAVSGA